MKKPLRLKKIQQMTMHDLKSYAHSNGKKAKRLRDEMARLGNRAAAAERAETRAMVELSERATKQKLAAGYAEICVGVDQAWNQALTG